MNGFKTNSWTDLKSVQDFVISCSKKGGSAKFFQNQFTNQSVHENVFMNRFKIHSWNASKSVHERNQNPLTNWFQNYLKIFQICSGFHDFVISCLKNKGGSGKFHLASFFSESNHHSIRSWTDWKCVHERIQNPFMKCFKIRSWTDSNPFINRFQNYLKTFEIRSWFHDFVSWK